MQKMTNLKDEYEMTQADVAEKMFLAKNTIGNIEKLAMEKARRLLAERGISAKDILGDMND